MYAVCRTCIYLKFIQAIKWRYIQDKYPVFFTRSSQKEVRKETTSFVISVRLSFRKK